jgi:predicted nucleic acid-binding protein
VSGSSYVLDTNIVLQLLNGDKILAGIVNNKALYLSFITEMELLSYSKLTDDEELRVKSFLNDCYVIEMNYPLKLSAINIRRIHKMKLPDSIIAATSEHLNLPLLTSDVEFNKLKSLQILQYSKG